jgi:hypothetical protein
MREVGQVMITRLLEVIMSLPEQREIVGTTLNCIRSSGDVHKATWVLLRECVGMRDDWTVASWVLLLLFVITPLFTLADFAGVHRTFLSTFLFQIATTQQPVIENSLISSRILAPSVASLFRRILLGFSVFTHVRDVTHQTCVRDVGSLVYVFGQ